MVPLQIHREISFKCGKPSKKSTSIFGGCIITQYIWRVHYHAGYLEGALSCRWICSNLIIFLHLVCSLMQQQIIISMTIWLGHVHRPVLSFIHFHCYTSSKIQCSGHFTAVCGDSNF